MSNNLPLPCAQTSVEPVQLGFKTVFELCTFFVQNHASVTTLRTIPTLCAGYALSYAPNHPLSISVFNSGDPGLIPTIHRPNSKNYLDILRKFKGKTVEKQVL